MGLQFGALTALIIFPAGAWWERDWVSGIVAGFLVALGALVAIAAGLRLGSTLTPLPIPKEDGALAQEGIYRFVRHPMYTGVLVAAAGVLVWGASLAHLVAWLFLLAVLSAKVSFEEMLLSEKYPEYGKYKQRTGRFFPPLRRPERTEK